MEEGNSYIKTHSRLHHTTDLAFNGSNSFHNNRDLTHISTGDLHVCACVLKIFNQAACRLFVEAGAADHGELLGATRHHPFGDAAADAAEAAGQQVGLCGGEDTAVFFRENL